MATSFRIWQAEPGGDGDGSLQDHHRPASLCPDSAQSTDRSESRLQRPQQDDRPRHADLRPYQIRCKPEGEMQPERYSCTNANQPPTRRSNPTSTTKRLFRIVTMPHDAFHTFFKQWFLLTLCAIHVAIFLILIALTRIAIPFWDMLTFIDEY